MTHKHASSDGPGNAFPAADWGRSRETNGRLRDPQPTLSALGWKGSKTWTSTRRVGHAGGGPPGAESAGSRETEREASPQGVRVIAAAAWRTQAPVLAQRAAALQRG